ncbi:glutaminyl-peptide cyclotransferase [Apibacter raozihei]|uniref:glutaminyl-peptide cyclotransferase n=1 Tax=Apibacter raozihei TaxID=2500547 RepID=UPI000FE34E38|nr:glutaminyl-peptide cyclotransferase [Apibacter raozihei]
MKFFIKYKLFLLSLLFITWVTSCKNDSDISVSTNFEQLDTMGLHIGDKLPLEFTSSDATINSYTIKLNDKLYSDLKEITLDSTNAQIGTNYLVLTLNYNGKHQKLIDATFSVYSKEKEKELTYKIVGEYPHNPELFTQGFTYQNGVITESSGQYGKSKLVRYPLGSTTYTQSVDIDSKFFAEGFAVLNKKLYLLTWRERTCLVFDESDFKLTNQFTYPGSIIEGWGATTMGKEIVISDSSSNLKFFDSDFNLKKTVTAAGYDTIYTYLNELEYANGYIYANVFDAPIILVINPATGSVVAKADFSELVKQNKTNSEAVLNGIAHVEGNTFLITGKLWSKIYKVEFNIK